MSCTPFRSASIAAFALAAAVLAADARAGDMCTIIMDGCPIGQLSAIDKDDRCETAMAQLFCYSEQSAPPRTQLVCARGQDGFGCSAWPKTADPSQALTYTWTIAGNLQFAAGGSDPSMQAVRCGPRSTRGIVRVEITSPVAPHLSSITSRLLDCERTAP